MFERRGVFYCGKMLFMNTHYQAIISAPFGKLGIRVEGPHLVGLAFLLDDVAPILPKDATTAGVVRALEAYFQNPRAELKIPLCLKGTDFQQRVWCALQQIPSGTTWTYAELAARVGSGPRAVANACGANPIALVVPCHRVVGKNGLGGFMQGKLAGALTIKQWLLKHERRDAAGA